MGTGYTRNDTSNNIADGNVINAADLDGEFDAIESAFNSSTGHTHDGTSAEGAPIEVLGPSQDVVITASVMRPKTTNTVDLGTSSLLYKDAFIDGTATIGGIVIDNDGTIGSASDTDAITISSSGIVTFSQAPIVDTESATTNSIINTLILRAQSSGTPAVGIGTGMRFEVETAAGNVEQGAAIRAVTTSLTPTDEEIDLVFLSMQNGSLVEAFRYDSTNDQLDVSGSIKIGSAQELKSNGTIKISADSDASGSGTINFKTNDVLRVGIQNNGDTYFYEDTGATIKMDWDATNEYLHFRDDVKAVFGTGTDLQIYHDASNSYISDSGTGELKLTTNGTGITFEKADGTEIFDVTTTDATKLYYNGNEKLATTSGGVDITGSSVNITGAQAATTLAIESTDAGAADGPVLDLYRNSSTPLADDDLGRIDFSGENDADTKIIYARIESYLEDPTNASEDGRMRLLVESNGSNLSFIDLDASQGGVDGRILFNAAGADIDFVVEGDTDSSLFVTDASTNNVGISIATPLEQLHVEDAIRIEAATPRLRFAETDGTADQNFQIQVASGNLKFQSNNDAFSSGGTRFDMDQSGNVAISSNGTAATSGARLLLRATSGQDGLRIVNEDGDAVSDPILDIYRDSSTPAANDNIGRLNFSGNNDADEKLSYARLEAQIKDVTDGSEDGHLKFLVRSNGSISEKMRVTESGLSVNFTDVSEAPLHVRSGGNDAVIIAESTDEDSSEGPQVWLRRDSASPANNDWLGVIKFRGNDSAGNETNYFEIATRANDVTDGSEQGYMRFLQTVGGAQINVLTFNGVEAVFNENGNDKDFRVEGDTKTHALFVRGSDSQVGIGTGSPSAPLHVIDDTLGAILMLETEDGANNDIAPELTLYRNYTTPADGDVGGSIEFNLNDSTGVNTTFSRIYGAANDVTNGTEDGAMYFHVRENGSLNEKMRINQGGVGIGITDIDAGFDLQVQGSSKFTKTNNDVCILLESTDADANDGPLMVTDRNSSSPANNDNLGKITHRGRNDAAEEIDYVSVRAEARTVTDGGEDGRYQISVMRNGTGVNVFDIDMDDVGDEVVINEGGNDIDFRVEGDADSNLIRTRASTDTIMMGKNGTITSTPKLSVSVVSGITAEFLRESTSNTATIINLYSDVGGADTLQHHFECNGDLEIQGTLTQGSDQRIKQDIVDSGSQWDDIKAIQVRKYRKIWDVEQYGDEADVYLGVIAQELEASGMGGLVKTRVNEEDPDDDLKSVRYSVLYMKAVKALQEAMERIETLETEQTAIKARLDALEN